MPGKRLEVALPHFHSPHSPQVRARRLRSVIQVNADFLPSIVADLAYRHGSNVIGRICLPPVLPSERLDL